MRRDSYANNSLLISKVKPFMPYKACSLRFIRKGQFIAQCDTQLEQKQNFQEPKKGQMDKTASAKLLAGLLILTRVCIGFAIDIGEFALKAFGSSN